MIPHTYHDLMVGSTLWLSSLYTPLNPRKRIWSQKISAIVIIDHFSPYSYIYIYSYYLSYIIFPNISLTSLMSQKNPTSASPGRPRKISLAPKTPVFGIPTTGTKKNSTVRHDFLFISDIPIVGWWNTNSIHMFYDVLWIARITRR